MIKIKMAKVYVTVGFAETVETCPGVWADIITERGYYGEILRSFINYQSSDKINDDVSISNDVSIVADVFANKKFHLMRYAKIYDVKWKITGVEVIYPRLKLSLGGVYNENEA